MYQTTIASDEDVDFDDSSSEEETAPAFMPGREVRRRHHEAAQRAAPAEIDEAFNFEDSDDGMAHPREHAGPAQSWDLKNAIAEIMDHKKRAGTLPKDTVQQLIRTKQRELKQQRKEQRKRQHQEHKQLRQRDGATAKEADANHGVERAEEKRDEEDEDEDEEGEEEEEEEADEDEEEEEEDGEDEEDEEEAEEDDGGGEEEGGDGDDEENAGESGDGDSAAEGEEEEREDEEMVGSEEEDDDQEEEEDDEDKDDDESDEQGSAEDDGGSDSDSDGSDAAADVVEEEHALQQAVRQRDAARRKQLSELERDDPEEAARARAYFAEGDADVAAAAEGAEAAGQGFQALHLSRPLLRAVGELGFAKPTPVQAKTIPVALAGKDLCASAQTGSGKTAAFLLPTLERLLFRPRRVAATRVLVITPTRELATQIHAMLAQLAKYTGVTSCCVVGGVAMRPQERELRRHPDIVLCTPGRMIDHLHNTVSVGLDEVEVLILDEADRLLEMGFAEEVEQLAKLSLNRPVRLSADVMFNTARHLVQEFVRVRKSREAEREAILLALCKRTFKSKTIVFFEHKWQAHRMMLVFGLSGLRAAELHGNLSQLQRLQSLQQFKDGGADLLLCTDLASRGIDIKGVECVINFEMPKDLTVYTHRVGRTARAGTRGRAVTLTGESRRHLMKQVAAHCTGLAKSRTVPAHVIEHWVERIEQLEPAVEDILTQERM
eukprot:g6195.t1